MKKCSWERLLEKCKSKLQWGITSIWSEWPSSKSLHIINAVVWRRGNLPILLICKLVQPLWKTVWIHYKTKNRVTVWWRRLLRFPWTARRSNQSILKVINPEYSLEGLMLKLKLQYFGHLMWRADSLQKALMLGRLKAGGEGDDRGWDGWMASLSQWTSVWASSRRWWRMGKPGMLLSMGSQWVRHNREAEQQQQHVMQWSHSWAYIWRKLIKKYRHSHVHCNNISNSQYMETT